MSILAIIDDLRKFLPIQYPLGVFIHNNMLLAFEDRPFREGVAEAAAMFGARQTLPDEYYREKWRDGRIDEQKAREGLRAWMLDQGVEGTIGAKPCEEILWDLLRKPETIAYRVSAMEMKSSFNDWAKLATQCEAPVCPSPGRPLKDWKGVLLQTHGEDINGLYQSVIIRFLSAYLDQGMATWHNPDTHRGLLESFQAFLETNRLVGPEWMERAYEELPRIPRDDLGGWLEGQLAKLPYTENPRQYLLETMLELRGWAGMVNKFEKEPHLVPRSLPKISLIEYLVINVLLERSAYDFIIQKLKLGQHPGVDLAKNLQYLTLEQMTHLLNVTGERFSLSPRGLRVPEANKLLRLLSLFDEKQRSRIWQEAFDLSVRDECLRVVATGARLDPTHPPIEARAYFCIDDREESLRRYVEEVNPGIETLGVVGFFGLDMRFKSADHPEAVAYCPPVITPSRTVEQVTIGPVGQRERERRIFGLGSQGFYYGSRATATSVLYTLLAGPITSCILLLRVFFPHLALRLLGAAKRLIIRPLPTKIHFNAEDGRGGYDVAEMASVVATIMKFTGTVENFPQLQFMVAHGASSSNNPYKNAYGCGACSGKAGIPNSQIFCGMANNPKVRAQLRLVHGIDIPASAFFVACYHDTSTDEVLCFNHDEAPEALRADVGRILGQLRLAAKKNSLERCRHFAAGRSMLDEKITLQHVQNRGANLAEPRPEYGHTNNALCVIGPRRLTQQLFLDRRSFLASYDARIDPDGKILAQVMAGAVPVAGGINLDYYFSRVDNEVYGSGTKLPLNVAGLLGVMTGGQSDLRIGLAGQMVELHEPVRITILIEAEPRIIEEILQKSPRQLRLVTNGWVHMAALHPRTREMFIFQDGAFRPHAPGVRSMTAIKDQRSYVAHQKGALPFGQLLAARGAP